MALTTWDPIHDLFGVPREMSRLLEDRYGVLRNPEARVSSWAPPVDIYETEDSYQIAVELPGVKKEDVALEVKESVLSIRGERRSEKEVSEKNVHRVERQYGAFQRAFKLPANIDAGRVKAVYKDGVLEITLPKSESARPRQIEIAA